MLAFVNLTCLCYQTLTHLFYFFFPQPGVVGKGKRATTHTARTTVNVRCNNTDTDNGAVEVVWPPTADDDGAPPIAAAAAALVIFRRHTSSSSSSTLSSMSSMRACVGAFIVAFASPAARAAFVEKAQPLIAGAACLMSK
jgi:hypothetical protein